MRAEVLKAIEELERTDVKSMSHFHHLGYAGDMKIAILGLLINNDDLHYDKTTLRRELDGEYGQLERTYGLVDELRGKVDVLSQTEKSVLKNNHITKSSILALTQEKMGLKRVLKSMGLDEGPDFSMDGEDEHLKSAHTRVTRGSRIPKSTCRGQSKKVKSDQNPKVVTSATQLQTISEDKGGENDEQIIPLTAKPKSKSACALLGESVEHPTALTNMDTKGKYMYEHLSESSSVSKRKDGPKTRLPKPQNHVSARVLVTNTSDVTDEVPTIHMEEESGNIKGDDKPATQLQKQKPATDFSMFLGGKKSAPRKEMFAEKPQEKRSLMSPLRNFFKTRKADRVEKIGALSKETKQPVQPRRSRIPIFRREKKKTKPEQPRRSKIPIFRREKKKTKLEQPRRSKIPIFRREKKKTKPEEPHGSKIPFFTRPKIFRRKVHPMPEQE